MKKKRKRKIIIAIIVIAAFFLALFIVFLCSTSLGKLPYGKMLERIKASPNYKDESFRYSGFQPEWAAGEFAGALAASRSYLFDSSKRNKPSAVLPSVKTDLFSLDPQENIAVWMGHSTIYLQIDGKKFLVDPVFSGRAFIASAFKGSDIYTPFDIPLFDFLIITHDHWDHLDYKTVTALESKAGLVLTGLGTGAHLEYWGYPAEKIIEHDWGETSDLGGGFSITTIGSPHFSGRLFSRNKSLWASFALETPNKKIFLSGDSGYAYHFTEAFERFGPFDIAFLECGQYNKVWRGNHMFPEDTARAAMDLGAKKFIPIHWAKFAISPHDWDDPIKRLLAECQKLGITATHPLIGELVRLDEEQVFSRWWEGIP